MADTNQILKLAAIIREVDGTHSKGAAALAESILDHPGFRAVLAEPEPEGPTDEELRELWNEGWDTSEEYGAFKHARAVLARWGRPAPQPADGEVAELVTWLRETGDLACQADAEEGQRYWSAADLLEQQATAYAICERERLHQSTRAADLEIERYPVPVPVSERLPEPSECAPWPKDSDASAWCWMGQKVDGGWEWEQRSAGYLVAFPGDFTHWLPAHALPLPEVGK